MQAEVPLGQGHFFMESVFSMDAKDRGIMSEVMGVWPYVVDAVDVTVCRRPRLYWISWEIMECDEVQIQVLGVLLRGQAGVPGRT